MNFTGVYATELAVGGFLKIFNIFLVLVTYHKLNLNLNNLLSEHHISESCGKNVQGPATLWPRK